ncbi:IclR family transcriptional regulator [Roseomonas sp. GC11]|uniref:IclR family transcriptional regulator n=1 Tax=Roseomonas sp. GC11 TaxID=2950546 RepID=UPI00210D3954|nr:IclR family transcriptional regulator [Roseomonas sp. GC11]MCQ4158421.1 IclR family transcriptional regulator [Roseomonas sp. GC11]
MAERDLNGGQVIARAAAVLRALEGEAEGLSLAALARATGLPRSTVQRLVTALQAQQMVAPLEGRLRLGPALARLAGAAWLDVAGIVRPHLEALARATRETANLSVLRGAHAVLADQVASDQELRVVTPVGTALPLHCTAHGKALLATLEEAEIARRLDGPWERRTARSLPGLPALLATLPALRAGGIAEDQGEMLEGVCALGLALETHTAERYALSVVMPEVRFARQRATVEAALRQAAHAIAGACR